MSGQDDVNGALAQMKSATDTLTALVPQLNGVGIDTSALPAATAALGAAMTAISSAVATEVAKTTPPPA